MIYLWIALPYVTWIFFLAVMNLIHAKKLGRLPKAALYLGTPVLVIGYVLDIAVNICILSPLTLSFPREFTTTAHLQRLIRGEATAIKKTWRWKVAFWICHNLLDIFDPSGTHC